MPYAIVSKGRKSPDGLCHKGPRERARGAANARNETEKKVYHTCKRNRRTVTFPHFLSDTPVSANDSQSSPRGGVFNFSWGVFRPETTLDFLKSPQIRPDPGPTPTSVRCSHSRMVELICSNQSEMTRDDSS